MSGRIGRAGLATPLFILGMVLAGCTSKGDDANSPVSSRDISQPAPKRGPEPRPISLPDLSTVSESVRQQLQESYSLLVQKIDNEGSTAELGRAYGEMGKLFMAADYLDAAEPCYLNAHALVPNEARWPYYLGHLYRNKGESEKAAAFFESTLRLQPSDVATLVWLAEIYLAQGKPESAEPLLSKVLSVQPRSVAALFGLGRAALATRDYARAVARLEEALALDQRAAGIHYPLAMAYRGLGERAKAEDHLRQVAKTDVTPPDPWMQEIGTLLRSAMVYELRGIRALEQGDWAAAIAHFRQGIQLEADAPSLRHRLGTALLMAGDGQGAQAQFDEALRLSPGFARAHYSLGVVMESAGRHREALEHFSAAVQNEPNYVEAHLQLADVLRRDGRLEEALAHYDRIINIDPRAGQARFVSAMVSVRLNRFQEARERLTEGMKVHPDQVEFAHALARLLAAAPDARVRDGRRAMTLMQELLKVQRGFDFGETMAMTLAELGKFEEAAALQRDVIRDVTQAGENDLARLMTGNLRLYESRRPCRTPWRNNELP